MRRKIGLALALFVTLTLVRPEAARAEMPVKARAFLTMAGYGAGAGALLGLASMAFGNSSRAVAQGASIGLYAGILFGTYVLVSHHNKQAGNYDDNASPYQESSDIYGEEGEGGEGGGNNRSGFFDRFQSMQELVGQEAFTFDSSKTRTKVPPIQMNFLHLEF